MGLTLQDGRHLNLGNFGFFKKGLQLGPWIDKAELPGQAEAIARAHRDTKVCQKVFRDWPLNTKA